MVSASTFVLMLAFNGLYVLFGYLSGLFDKYPVMMPSKADIIRYAVIYTFAYAIVIWLCIYCKRRWRRTDDGEFRPEDLLLAVFAYFATVWLNVIFSLILRGGQLTYAPFLYALNQAILGYFIGLYIDLSMKSSEVSVGLALIQATVQATSAVIATTLSPSVFSPTFGILDLQIAAFASLQAAFSGFIISILFQRLYGRTRLDGSQLAPKPAGHVSANSGSLPLSSKTTKSPPRSEAGFLLACVDGQLAASQRQRAAATLQAPCWRCA